MAYTDNKLITFSYEKCSQQEIESREYSFREDIFRQELDKAFDTKLQIQRIHITLTHQAEQSVNPYTCVLDISGRDLKHSFTQKGDDPAQITRQTIKHCIEFVHKEKQKYRKTPTSKPSIELKPDSNQA